MHYLGHSISSDQLFYAVDTADVFVFEMHRAHAIESFFVALTEIVDDEDFNFRIERPESPDEVTTDVAGSASN